MLFYWVDSVIFMVKRGAMKVLRSEGGPPKKFAIIFFFASGPPYKYLCVDRVELPGE